MSELRAETLAETVAIHDGVRPIEQGEGDSFVIAFGCATDAVACALDLQRAPLAPIRLRIGIHTGEVRLRDEGNYIGPTINRTARLRDLPRPESVMQLCTQMWVRTFHHCARAVCSSTECRLS